MSSRSPALLVRVADSLVDEVAESTDSVLKAARSLSKQEGFLAGLQGLFGAASLVKGLRTNLELAVKLCDAAAQANPALILDDGMTPARVKARALLQQGLISMGHKGYKDAVKYFEQSLALLPDQATYFNTGLCFVQMKGLFSDRTQDAVAAFDRCIELSPDSDLAVAAGKQLAWLGRL